MSDTAEVIERAAKRAEALKAAKTAALLEDDFGPAQELAQIEDAEVAAAEDAAALADAIGKAKTGRELAKLAPGQPTLVGEVRSDWIGSPPDREWLAGSGRDGWLPAGRVAMLTGPGESGKSRLALQLAVAVAGDAGAAEARRVIPSDRPAEDAAEDAGPVIAASEPATVALVGWEDEAAEAWRRVAWLRSAGLLSAGALADRLHYLDAAAANTGALWGPEQGNYADTVSTWTAQGLKVLAWLEDLAPRLVILDPLAAAYGGNENDRAAVRAFLSALNAWAASTGAAVLVIAHPAKGDGPQAVYSGSTDWRNGVRALWTLRRERVPGFKAGDGTAPPEAPALTLDKASYGGGSGARVWLRSAGNPQDGSGLAWRECSAHDALAAELDRRGLDMPERTAAGNGGTKRTYAPGEVAP